MNKTDALCKDKVGQIKPMLRWISLKPLVQMFMNGWTDSHNQTCIEKCSSNSFQWYNISQSNKCS